MNFEKLIKQVLSENEIPSIQKNAKYFQNLSYRQGIHSGRVSINWKTGKPFTPEEIAAAELTSLTPEEEAELQAYEREQRRQQDSFSRANLQDYRGKRGADYR